MRQTKLHILFLLFMLPHFSFGQQLSSLNQKPSWLESLPSKRAMILNSNVFRTRVDLTLLRIADKYGTPLSKVDTFKLIARARIGIDYKIVSEDENGYMIICVLPKVILSQVIVKNDTTNTIQFTENDMNKTDSINASNYLFAIKNDDLPPLSKIPLSTKLIASPLVHPFKLRPSASNSGVNFTTDFTISNSFGLRFKISKNPLKPTYLNFVFWGFGLGDSKYVYEMSDGSLSEEKDAVALTYYSWGFFLSFNKVNVGLFQGFDAMIDKQNNWIYQSKPWFSFGFGYKFNDD